MLQNKKTMSYRLEGFSGGDYCQSKLTLRHTVTSQHWYLQIFSLWFQDFSLKMTRIFNIFSFFIITTSKSTLGGTAGPLVLNRVDDVSLPSLRKRSSQIAPKQNVKKRRRVAAPETLDTAFICGGLQRPLIRFLSRIVYQQKVHNT